ncbi:hypothetical protein C0J52_24353 [Blattella germanica]|nr:hypothetical protein C0J52_24353 [Blattella germanica]
MHFISLCVGPTLGLLLLCIAGTHCWQWGSSRSCPPGEEPECPKNPLNDTVNYFPHPTDCHYYVQCDSNGKAICRRCSPTTYFNPHISNCVWPLDARCETNATTRQSSLLPPICVPDRDEIDGSLLLDEPCQDASDCSYYYRNCTERTKCPDKQHYNNKTKRCENWCMAGCQNPLDIPDCRQCPREGEILNHECEKYMICTNGVPVQVQCKSNEHFDTVTKTCVPGSCCEDKPDLKNCSFYITNCNERVQCPPNQHFNAKTKRCEDFCIAGCQSPWKIAQCRECQTDGDILQFDCHYYTKCVNGKPEQFKCKLNEHFDQTIGKCMPGSCCEDEPDTRDCSYYITNCDQRTKCPTNQHFNKNTKRCENICTAGCQNPLDIPQCRQCKEGEILQSDCQFYSICRNNQIEQVKCNINEHFDQKIKKCVPGSCCEDKPDPNDCGYYITNCNQRTPCPPNQHYNKNTRRCENICTAGCQNPLKIPQCRQCPTEGQIIQYDCQFYTICNNGKPEKVTCNDNEHFDLTANKCIPGSCCEDKPDPNDCGYFITNCNQRVPCPPNQHYNKKTGRCENICTAGCQNPLQIPQCRQCQTEGEILQSDCQYFTICKNGVPQQVKCNINEHFDMAAKKCVPGSCCEDKPDPNDCSYYITNCNQRVQCPPNQHYNRNTKRCENVCSAGCQNPLEISQCRQCPVEGQILQYECQYYSVCKNGKPQQVKCNINEHFDHTAQRCVPGSCCEDKPDPSDCGYYITNCNQRTPCPPNQHYNKNTKRCEDFCTAGCLNPLDIPQCRQCPREGEILQFDCQYYTICRNGIPEQIKCNINEHFDEQAHKCIPGSCCDDQPDPNDCSFYIINCNQRVQCPQNQHFNKRTKKCEDACTAGCLNPQDLPQCRNCVEGNILQSDCQYYVVCRNNQPEQVKCNINEHFDQNSKRCVPGSCCEDKPDPNDCSFYITNCNQRVQCPQNQHFNRRTKKCEDACTAGCLNPSDLPQCRNCPEGKILQSDCQYYVICRNNQPEQVKCNVHEHFDQNAKRCVPGPCCEDKPDPTDCAYYITNCNQRTPCPPNQHYNRANKRCEDKCLAGCVDPKQLPECHGECQPEGKTFEDPCSCEMYYKCENGKKVLGMCDKGLHYNSTLGRCDAPCGDVCVKLFARKPECCASTKGKPEPHCPSSKLSIFLPHPSDSRWFYQCVDGVLYCNRCPPGHRWNIDEDTCDESCQCP